MSSHAFPFAILGMVQVRQVPSYIVCGSIRCGSLIPWGWGWLHRSWSFAIPKLRLSLPPGIEPCPILTFPKLTLPAGGRARKPD